MKKLFKSVRFWLIVILPLTFLLKYLFANCTEAANFYCDYIYRYISVLFNRIAGIFPFSLAEYLIVTAVIFGTFYVFFIIVSSLMSSGKRARTFLIGISNLLCIVSAGFFIFNTNCGFNYYRSDFEELSGMKTSPPAFSQRYSRSQRQMPGHSEKVRRHSLSSRWPARPEKRSSLRFQLTGN